MRPRQSSQLTIIRTRFNVECFSPFHISRMTHKCFHICHVFLKINIATIEISENIHCSERRKKSLAISSKESSTLQIATTEKF
jgi:hypothetical protein